MIVSNRLYNYFNVYCIVDALSYFPKLFIIIIIIILKHDDLNFAFYKYVSNSYYLHEV